jgi:DNA-directed RNA polymerase specialized sigma24 family protein
MAIRTPPQPVPGTKNLYLNNKDLLAEVKKSKRKGEMSDRLARMLQMLCARYAKKGNFINYTYNQDMQAYAMMMLVRTWNSFNPEKSSNPFAFFTQCIKNSFIQYLNQEKRQRNIRDLALVDQGLNPSFGFDQGGMNRGAGTEEGEVTMIEPSAYNDEHEAE